MPSQYNPQDHIQHLAIVPHAEGILDQREITIQSYQTTIPFDYAALDRGIESAWLTPQIRFGVFARTSLSGTDALHVVLGLQDELAVRAYDYDARRPIWFAWQNAIVTVKGGAKPWRESVQKRSARWYTYPGPSGASSVNFPR